MNSSAFSTRRPIFLWVLSLLLFAGCGASTSQSVNNQPPPPPPAPSGVAVSPSSLTTVGNSAARFTATVSPNGANPAVTWSVSGTGCMGAGCGTIDATGTYIPPMSVPNPPTVTVIATSVTDSTKFGSATVTVSPARPLPSPSATLLIRDTPPDGVAVLSFSVAVTGAVLQPGDVNLVTNQVLVEINRQQVETALLASLPIPSGTYTSLTVTFANPVLTIQNNSGVASGSCANGAICKLSPALAVSSVHFTDQPFPITSKSGSEPVLLLDFDLGKSLSDLGTIDPVVTVEQILPADVSQSGLSVKQVAGKITYTGGDDIADGASFDLVTALGTITGILDYDLYGTQYVDAKLCGLFYCVQDEVAEVDLRLLSSNRWDAIRVTLKPPEQPELEGVIVGIHGDTQFDIVLLHQVPSVAGLAMGDLVRINLQPGATIEAVDIDPRRNGLLFSGSSDLLVGQVVTARTRSAPSGTPVAVTTDRVRLKSGAFTARVKSILNADDFIVDSLPGNFSSVQVQVETNTQTNLLLGPTNFLGISDVADLKVGDKVSLSGLLLKTMGDPVLLAEGVRKR